MPELPEVETIARFLREGGRNSLPISGKTLTGGRALWPRTLEVPVPSRFASRLKGQKVLSIGRRGKFIVIKLTTDTLLIHLRMSGDLRCEPALDDSGNAAPLQPHDRLVIEFTDHTRLAFNDPRKFGRVWLLSDPQTLLDQLGPEPLDLALTAGEFHHMLTSRRRQLKPLLLDQTFLAGLGNIYTDESLHLARLHPLTLSDSLDAAQANDLLRAIRSVLEEGIRRNGASIDWVYRGGDFQNAFRVYQRTGQPCPVCGTPIERITVGQRGTHFCPVCQPKP
jgi:formamidopyrimidine-DNA glycosylase